MGGATGAGPGYQIAGIPQVTPSVLAEGVIGAVPGSPFQPHNRLEAVTLWLRGWSGPLSSLLAGVPKAPAGGQRPVLLPDLEKGAGLGRRLSG